MRQVVLDTETTGLEVSQGHRIIEIGCVELINRRRTNRTWHQYIQPDRDIDDGAVAGGRHGGTGHARLNAESRAPSLFAAGVLLSLITYVWLLRKWLQQHVHS